MLSVVGAIFILVIFIAKDIFGGGWTIIFCKKLQNGVRKIRIFIVGAVLITVSLLSLVVSVVYIWVTTTKMTEVIVFTVIILFINTLDEEVFILLEKVYPETVRDEIELIKLSYADIIETNQPNLEEHDFSSQEGEEINDTVEVEHEEEI